MGMENEAKTRRSRMARLDARKRYIELGELAVLERIQADAHLLDTEQASVGPFARLDANAVAAVDGKTRGVISNLFGNQARFQAETMSLALSAGHWIDEIDYPAPDSFATADAWLDAFLSGQAERGPRHGADPTVNYASVWTLWLSTLPYGVWSEKISAPSMEELKLFITQLERLFGEVIDHFGLRLHKGTTLTDIAAGMASLIEGIWLNQCLTMTHPGDDSQPIAAHMVRSGRLMWRGATERAEGRTS
jgi:hypothetical protein